MEVGGVLVPVLFAAVSLPCLLLLLVLAEAGLRLTALALRGGRCAWPSRSAFLGYRIARGGAAAGGRFYSSSPGTAPGLGERDEPLLPPETCDRLALAVHRGGAGGWVDVDCAFCLTRVEDGAEVRDLRCRHVFHRACLDAWLVRPRATCPLCRDRLLPPEPPRPCADVVDDDYNYGNNNDDYDDDTHFGANDGTTSSSSAAVAYPRSVALWHM